MISCNNFYFLVNLLLLIPFCSFASIFTVTNYCPQTIWPGSLAGAGTPALPTTGFRLDPGQTVRIPSFPGWSGRIWARTGCKFDASGVGRCQTGDCGGRLQCDGMGAAPPVSLFEITLGTGDGKDFYDVSIVDGYNLPLVAVPRGTYGTCNATGCASNINTGCPRELQVVGGEEGEGGNVNVIACKSACEAFGSDQYCCSGEFANPSTCRPSFYSTIFKTACPRAYSYAFDDGTSTFTCKAFEYDIIFCPHNGMKRSTTIVTAPPPPPPTQVYSPAPPTQVYSPAPPTQESVYPAPPTQVYSPAPPMQESVYPAPPWQVYSPPPPTLERIPRKITGAASSSTNIHLFSLLTLLIPFYF